MGAAIVEIKRFQTDRGLHLKEYNPINEHANIVEELLESLGFDVPKENRKTLLNKWREFAAYLVKEGVAVEMEDHDDDSEVDAYCDTVVFAVGAIMKLGYDPEAALLEASKVINSRVGNMIDGKFEKDLSPEAQANWHTADYAQHKVKYVDHSENDSLDYDKEGC